MSEPTVTRLSKFLRMVEQGVKDECAIIAKDNFILCVLKYYPRWKQWVMIPSTNSIWSHDCLETIRQELIRRNTKTGGGR